MNTNHETTSPQAFSPRQRIMQELSGQGISVEQIQRSRLGYRGSAWCTGILLDPVPGRESIIQVSSLAHTLAHGTRYPVSGPVRLFAWLQELNTSGACHLSWTIEGAV